MIKKKNRAKKRRGRPFGITRQGQEMKDHIYKVALDLIQVEGYEQATLGKIAEKARISSTLLYKYYPDKTALILQFYDELSKKFELSCKLMKATSWKERSLETLKMSFESLAPHRKTLLALLTVFFRNSRQNLFAPDTKFSRQRVEGVFLLALSQAPKFPPENLQKDIARIIYTIHLAMILLWLLDKSPKQIATKQAMKLLPSFFWFLSMGLKFNRGQRIIRQVSEIITTGLMGEK